MFNFIFRNVGKSITIGIVIVLLPIFAPYEYFSQTIIPYSYIFTHMAFDLISVQNSQFFIQTILTIITTQLIISAFKTNDT